MQRRQFIGLLGVATVWPVLARAQQPGKKPVVGILWHGSAEKEWANPFYFWLHDDLASLGYASDKSVKFEERYASEKQESYEKLASDLVSLEPDVLIAPTLAAALALKKATARIPIVFLSVPDPVGSGLVASVARPGGNITGMISVTPEMYFKRVAILKEVIPNLSRLALLADLDSPTQVALEIEYYAAAVKANGVHLEVFGARDKITIDEAFQKITQAGCDAVAIAGQGIFYLLRDELSEAALSHRLPTMAAVAPFVSSGILLSYGQIPRGRFHETAVYAARILRGEKPSDLPVQFPTKFELALNLKTAAKLNLPIPTHVLTSADPVFE